MRDMLSRMYYNYDQSLRREGQWRNATDAALARRELWKGNGDRLLGVAAELAELDFEMQSKYVIALNDAKLELDKLVLATLQQAFDSGWPQKVDPATEKRYACFQKNKLFAAKIAEFNERFLAAATGQLDKPKISQTNTN